MGILLDGSWRPKAHRSVRQRIMRRLRAIISGMFQAQELQGCSNAASPPRSSCAWISLMA
eukprot:9872254-Alexandrium_andersonii.AAC.1